jgi:glycosyltransferase involved in cell wall biosynthesis
MTVAFSHNRLHATRSATRTGQKPLRVLELRCADGAGGGPEKTILLGAARADPSRYRVTVCYLREQRDADLAIATRAQTLGIDYVEIRQRHALDWRVWRSVRRLVDRLAIDIVHAHDYKTDLLALALARRGGPVPLATTHGWSDHGWRARLVYYPVDRRLLCRFPRVIAVSRQIRTELLRAGADPRRISVLRNGIDHRAFRRDVSQVPNMRARYGIRPGEVAIGAVGRLEPVKRFDLLLEAFAAVRKGRPGLRLLIAGDGSLKQELVTAAKRLRLGESCRFLGHVGAIASFYHALDLFVQSSGSEGSPNVVLEAMALETPVVATDVGGTRELVADGVHGLLVRPRDAGALSRALEQTLADAEATARRTLAARTRVEQELSFDARLRALEKIYESLVARRGSPVSLL